MTKKTKKVAKKRTKAVRDVKVAAANDAQPTAPVAKLTAEQVSANRSEGIRLYKLAGRPSKAQFIKVFGKDGAKWTWERRAKEVGLASAEEAAAQFQKMLTKAVSK